MKITLQPTERGFMVGRFDDLCGKQCSIQHSSLADDRAIWLGVDDVQPLIRARDAAAIGRDDLLTDGPERLNGWVSYPIPDCVFLGGRMELNQEQVAALIPLLLYFLEHGELPRTESAEWSVKAD